MDDDNETKGVSKFGLVYDESERDRRDEENVNEENPGRNK